jgi:hypothetical protein
MGTSWQQEFKTARRARLRRLIAVHCFGPVLFDEIGIVFVGPPGILIVAVVGAAPWAVALALLGAVIREIIRRRKKAKPAA